MRIATWNVNSIRSRIDRVEAWLARSDVDVLAIQETKAKADQFPMERLQACGYEVAHHGFNQWNGVAILSRVGLTDVRQGFPGMPSWGEPPTQEARALGATCGGIQVWSIYAPNGRHLTDPHMDYKIDWLTALRDEASGWLAADPTAPIALMGDWNIAPRDEDVWSMEFYTDKSHVSPRERAAFDAVVEAGFADVVRPHTPGPGVYTYWDYQQLRFPKKQGMRIDFVLGSPAFAALVEGAFADVVRPHTPGPGVYTYWDYQQLRFPKKQGMRIDFVLGSPAFAARVEGAVIDREERKGTGASDHAPVVVQLAD